MKIYIAAGSNIDPENILKRASGTLAQRILINKSSMFYKTAPIGITSGIKASYFINGIFQAESSLQPAEIRMLLRSIEAKYGRVRTEDKNTSRTLDLDLVLYGNWIIDKNDYSIPDPDITTRDFLSVPLKELDPELIIPGIDRAISEIAPLQHTMQSMPKMTAIVRTQIDIYRRLHEYR
jgi:2-amino-4-hydroxy-6-hydroxymethyldihydropteridine diphosphokinase